jgi:TRAP-type mannitol/chloroaromatic compound transport system substrate-binding protein|tara:strand:+ start:537 stop:1694 length:1158 start_codon:yes stop_codon:yes gene_type:complete
MKNKKLKPLYKRREILIGASAIGAAGLLTACKDNLDGGTPDNPKKSTAISKNIIQWRMVTCWPRDFPGGGTHSQKLAKRITQSSDGRLEIKNFAAGELVPAFEVFDAVRDGTAQCGHAAPYYWISKHKAIPFFCTVPGGMTASEKAAWIIYGGGQDLWDELYAEFGVKSFLAGNTSVQMGGWFQKEINSLQDFQGIKMRMPGLGAEVVNRMGGTAVNMPAGEIMPSLQSGVIDAAEWVGPWNDLALGFYKVAKYYYGPGFHEGGTTNELIMNKESYDELSTDLKSIVRDACHASALEAPAEYFANSGLALDVLVNKHNVDVRPFPKDVITKMFSISKEVVDETALLGDMHAKIHKSWSNFLKQSIKYQKYSDYGYMRDRAETYNI